jgi:hypothetical protein
MAGDLELSGRRNHTGRSVTPTVDVVLAVAEDR